MRDASIIESIEWSGIKYLKTRPDIHPKDAASGGCSPNVAIRTLLLRSKMNVYKKMCFEHTCRQTHPLVKLPI